VLSKEETCSVTTSFSSTPDKIPDYLSMPFILIELKNAISSRISTAHGLDRISPLMFKYFPSKGLDILLKILNGIWNSGAIPFSWREFKVIPIPKHGPFSDAYRPIFISSMFCKLVEYILKIRIDYYFESKSLILNNLYGFCREMGTMECLAALIGPIYQSFCSKEFLSAAFVDIKDAYNSIHIPT